jgi:hypothetical protein
MKVKQTEEINDSRCTYACFFLSVESHRHRVRTKKTKQTEEKKEEEEYRLCTLLVEKINHI